MTTLVQGEGELLSPAMVNTGPGAADPDGSPEAPGNHLPNVSVERNSEGFVLISLRPGGQISAEDGALARERYLTLTGGQGTAVLLRISGVEHVTRDAFRFFSEAVTITAFAVLGSTPVDRVIAHGRRGLPMPKFPSRYFSDEEQALAWLRTLNTTAG